MNTKGAVSILLMLAVSIVLGFLANRTAVVQREIATATVFVNVVLEDMVALPTGAEIELVGEGVSTHYHADTRSVPSNTFQALPIPRVATLQDVRYGRYTLKVIAPDSKPVIRRIIVDASEKWFTVAVPLRYESLNLYSFQMRIETTPASLDHPMWARLLGVYSEKLLEARMDDKGIARFRSTPGDYVLIVVNDEGVCSTTKINLPLDLDVSNPQVAALDPRCGGVMRLFLDDLSRN